MSDLRFNSSHKIRQIVCLLLLSFVLGFGSFAQAAKREMSMTIDEMVIDVAPDLKYKVFAFNGQVPGPLIPCSGR